MCWLISSTKSYMPAEDILAFVQERLRVAAKPKQSKATERTKKRQTRSRKELGSLGRMKGRYTDVLIDFWSGNCNPPDTLNTAIRLLALSLPHYRNEEEATDLVEGYIDELPDHSFSDRLTGNRQAVSRIVRRTVRQVYEGHTGQPEPKLSAEKITRTVEAWRRKGFDPTNKKTWSKSGSIDLPLGKEFFWSGQEMQKLAELQGILKTDLETTAQAVKYFLRLVKAHPGEIAVALVARVLERFNIACGHHGKVNDFLRMLRDWNWIYVRAAHKWYERDENGAQRKGRATSYGIDAGLIHKFGRPVVQKGPET
jgi:hypothetical protein